MPTTDELNRLVNKLFRSVRILNGSLHRLSNDATLSAEVRAALRADVAAAQEALDEHELRIRGLDARVTTVEERVSGVDRRVTGVDDRVTRLVTGDVASHTVSITDHAKRLTKLEADVRASTAERVLLANLSYYYALLSEAYRTEAETIRSQLGMSVQRRDEFLRVSAVLFFSGLRALASTVTANAAETLLNPVLQALWKSCGSVYYAGGQKGLSDFTNSEDATKALHLTSDSNSHTLFENMVLDKPVETLFDFMNDVTNREWHTLEADPFEFFQQQQTQLQSLARDFTGSGADAAVIAKTLKSVTGRSGALTSGEVAAHDPITVLKERFDASNHEHVEKWEQLEARIKTYVRQLIWRNHCRKQWANSTYNYVVLVDGTKVDAVAGTKGVDPEDATTWPSDVWDHSAGFGEIRAKQHIWSAFRTGNETGDDFDKRVWISKSYVHCCQIRVKRGTARFWYVDLERNTERADPVPPAAIGTKVTPDRAVVDPSLLTEESVNVVRAGGSAADAVKIIELRCAKKKQGRSGDDAMAYSSTDPGSTQPGGAFVVPATFNKFVVKVHATMTSTTDFRVYLITEAAWTTGLLGAKWDAYRHLEAGNRSPEKSAALLAALKKALVDNDVSHPTLSSPGDRTGTFNLTHDKTLKFYLNPAAAKRRHDSADGLTCYVMLEPNDWHGNASRVWTPKPTSKTIWRVKFAKCESSLSILSPEERVALLSAPTPPSIDPPVPVAAPVAQVAPAAQGAAVPGGHGP